MDFQPACLLFGGSLHAALECWFRCQLEGLEATPASMLSAFHDEWRQDREKAGKDVPVRFNKGQDTNNMQPLPGAGRPLTVRDSLALSSNFIAPVMAGQ